MIYNKNKKDENYIEFLVFILIEVILLSFLFSLFSLPVLGGLGEPNETITTKLNIGDVYPEVLNVSIDNNSASVTLSPNTTKTVVCRALIRDYNNDTDLDTVSAKFFDNGNSSFGDSNDNNHHYTNSSCDLINSFTVWEGVVDSVYLALANCTFEVWYYSNSSTWNCTVVVNDSRNWIANGSDTILIPELLALVVPDQINYGIVNSTQVSQENITNVSNAGNVDMDLALSGYADTIDDGKAMNCTLGTVQNISIDYEKYNLTNNLSGPLTLAEFDGNYTNLTGTPVIHDYNLSFRKNDGFNEAINETYWRIYVPIGVAGTCQGNIVFGAVKSPSG